MTHRPADARRPKVAIISPMIAYRSRGAGSMALWIIEALKADYDLSLITTGRLDIGRLNETWGTSIAEEDFTLVRVPQSFLKYTDSFTILRGALLGRFCRRMAPRFEAMFATYGVMDFGRRGIQYIGDFLFAKAKSASLYKIPGPGAQDWLHRRSLPRRLYEKLADTLDPASWPRIWTNLTLVNSEWTRKLMREEFGVETTVVYPPVPGVFPQVPWDRREPGFVVVAKLSPIKQIDRAMDIVSRVRERGHDVHLHILGWDEDRAYAQSLREYAALHPEWCFLEGEIFGEAKIAFLSGHKFGLNTTQNEAFGVGVAELVKAGCIPFVPDAGGQVEIVGHPDLQFRDEADAAAKIDAVLRDPVKQKAILLHLAGQGEKFGVERYMAQIRDAVGRFLREEAA